MDVAIAVGITVGLKNFVQQGIKQAKRRNSAVLVSISEPHWTPDTADTIAFYQRAQHLTSDRFYWSQPDKAFAFVGLGTAWTVEAVEESRFRQVGTSWRELLQGAVVEGPHGLPGVGPLIIGGFAFDPSHTATDLWSGYGDGRMVLPELLYTVHGNEAWITYNLIVTPDTDPDAKVAAITTLRDAVFNHDSHAFKSTTQRSAVQRVAMRELISADEWKAAVAATACDIGNKKLHKAVLARAVRLEALTAFDTADALGKLTEQYRDCFIFAIAHDDRCFLGATPGRLANVRDGQLLTMSLAGSTRRGGPELEDPKRANNSSKCEGSHEHALAGNAFKTLHFG